MWISDAQKQFRFQNFSNVSEIQTFEFRFHTKYSNPPKTERSVAQTVIKVELKSIVQNLNMFGFRTLTVHASKPEK